jgi:hypothetical protein
LFLAHVFNEVERGLKQRFSDDNLFLIWNIGCPMDYLDEMNRKREWESMAGVAMELRRRVASPTHIALLADAAARIAKFAVPSQSKRNYSIQPEGLAAVKAFLESPRAEGKTYAIVDVGAGTTEVSFFFNGRIMTEPGQPHRPSYLADSTQPVGGGRIDIELANAWKCSPDEARRRKEAGESNLPILPSIRTIGTQYERTCYEIVRNLKLVAANDKRFDLFIIGGGGRLRPLQDALPSLPLPGGFVRENWRRLQPPNRLTGRLAIQEDYDLLANACGLASSVSWEYYPPRDVPAMPCASAVTKPKHDVEEYYPK